MQGEKRQTNNKNEKKTLLKKLDSMLTLLENSNKPLIIDINKITTGNTIKTFDLGLWEEPIIEHN